MNFLHWHKPQTPQLNSKPENALFDRLAILAELDLIDTFKNYVDTMGNGVDREGYKALAEVYSFEYDNHYQDMSNMLVVEGIIVEMYSDIFKHEHKNGESKKTKNLKNRILLLKDGFENLKKYYSKYDEIKLILKQSIIERQKVMRENADLKRQLENIKKAEEF